ncbi:hypothetical protein KIH74_17600 [Kineosporia sp. J2-2]|uniref:Uncharacterized protein n=1 Tax=Kineosporia corallincola TaxID=2835133 RepID=A0ABS5TI64_9ACTN|nr:hypothetical protein [Kineosporia corallincola]MBT0770762.1 hypothetical protein [Kineosporia corallincola]
MREIRHPEDHRWARTLVVDHEAVDHERQIGEVQVADGAVIRVRVAQRTDFDLLLNPVVSKVHPPRITLGETFELDAAQARALAEQLCRAAAFIERMQGQIRRPSLVTEIRRRQAAPGS